MHSGVEPECQKTEKKPRDINSNAGLAILYTNACSINNKWSELKAEINEIDCVAVTETWLKGEENLDAVCPTGYCAHRADRSDGRQGGGALLLIAEHIQQTETVQHITPDVQAIAVNTKVARSNITVVCVYRSPSASEAENSELLTHLGNLASRATKLVILGDFNAPEIDWSMEWAPQNTFGGQLIQLIRSKGLVQHVNQPTRWRVGQTPGLLDLVLTKEERDVVRLHVCPPLGRSDHGVLRIGVAGPLEKPPDKWRRSFRRLDVQALISRARQLSWDSESESIEGLWMRIRDNILLLTEEFAPLKRIRRKGLPPWWRSKAVKAQKRKGRAWKRFKVTGGYRKFLEYKREASRAVDIQGTCRRQYELRLALGAKKCPKAYFNYVQAKANRRAAVGCVIDADGNQAESSDRKAEVLKDFFVRVHTLDEGQQAPEMTPREVQEMTEVEFEEASVSRAIASLHPQKAAGPDGIHPAILGPLADVIATPVCRLFARSMEEGTLPAQWKVAEVVPIHKGGSAEATTNYRPVSLLPVLLKVMEKVIREKVAQHVVDHGILDTAQHGFMKGRSCLTNLLSFLDEVTQRLDEGQRVEVCYLDFRKAFDSVNHRLLIHKLRSMRLAPNVLRWLEKYLTDRLFYVRVEGAKSSEGRVCSGVPQGSVLGPLLFLLYVNDLAERINCPVYLFADDVKLVGDPSTDQVERALLELQDWTAKWALPLNVAKCRQLLLNGTDAEARFIGADNPQAITRADCVKDLGVIIHETFKPSQQCLEAAKRANRALFQLLRTVLSRDARVLIPLYTVYVRPHLEYAVQAWAPMAVRDAEVLEQVQRRFTRRITGMGNLSYEDRLSALNLFSLRHRRARGDLIETFKQVKGFSCTSKELFTLRGNPTLRGHDLVLEKQRATLNIRANFFSLRVVNNWNKLTNDVVSATSVVQFKKYLDSAWQSVFPYLA